MDGDGTITLTSYKPGYQDEYGVWRDGEKKSREVFCQPGRGITRSEFYDAGRNGLNPEFSVLVFTGDYEGEQDAVYNGLPYAIYRTYKDPGSDYIELYCQRKGGTNGKA